MDRTPERQPRQQEPHSPGPDRGIQRRQPNAPRRRRQRRSEGDDNDATRRARQQRQQQFNRDIDDAGQKGQTGQTYNVGFFFLWNCVSNLYCNSKAVFWRLQRQGRPFVAWIHKRKKLLIPWRFWSHGREKDNKLDHFLVKNDQVERGKFRSKCKSP